MSETLQGSYFNPFLVVSSTSGKASNACKRGQAVWATALAFHFSSCFYFVSGFSSIARAVSSLCFVFFVLFLPQPLRFMIRVEPSRAERLWLGSRRSCTFLRRLMRALLNSFSWLPFPERGGEARGRSRSYPAFVSA